jgi:hypothetical protein
MRRRRLWALAALAGSLVVGVGLILSVHHTASASGPDGVGGSHDPSPIAALTPRPSPSPDAADELLRQAIQRGRESPNAVGDAASIEPLLALTRGGKATRRPERNSAASTTSAAPEETEDTVGTAPPETMPPTAKATRRVARARPDHGDAAVEQPPARAARVPSSDDAARTDLSLPAQLDALRASGHRHVQRLAEGATGVGLFEGSEGVNIEDVDPAIHDVARDALATAADVDSAAFSVSNDVQLFVIWGGAMPHARRILHDMRTKFVVLGVSYFDWPLFAHPDKKNASKTFEDNLWRVYSGKGGWVRKGMPLKVTQCGMGPFIAAVVLDPDPAYKAEHTAHGLDTVNHNMNDAKKEYRKWSGGGFKVHGTFSGLEAQHDIPFLFGRDAADFLRAYRESHGEAMRGLVDDFIAWGAAGNVPQLTATDGAAHGDLGGGNGDDDDDVGAVAVAPVAKPHDSIDTFVRLVAAATVNEARVVGGEDGGAATRRVEKPIVAHRWRRPFRVTPKPEVLPLGGPAAAKQQREESEADAWFVVPYRTTFDTFGMHGWRSCRQLLQAARTFKLSLFVHRSKAHKGDEAVPVPATFAACPTWPAEIDVRVTKTELWAVVAAFGGQEPLDGDVGSATNPPTTFRVFIAGTPYTFHFGFANARRGIRRA